MCCEKYDLTAIRTLSYYTRISLPLAVLHDGYLRSRREQIEVSLSGDLSVSGKLANDDRLAPSVPFLLAAIAAATDCDTPSDSSFVREIYR